MYRIKYETWEKICNLVREYSIKYGKFYFQLYPIKFCNNYKVITTKEFFQNNILNGRFLTEETNYNICENYEIKKDGTFRNKVLISPILYLYYTALVMEISKKYKQKRNDNISVRYAGNFTKEELHYKNQYYEFINELQEQSNKYDTYIKLDIKDFFEKIDINKMTVLLKNSIAINEKEQMQFKELISFIGNKKFPQIDAGIASSYLATIVYLDIIDNKYYRQIKNILDTEEFKMVRYVDDLYIFFNAENLQLNKIENKLTYEYTNLIHEYSLNVNMGKTHLRDSSLIYEDINSISLEDEAVLEEELSDDFTKNALENFFYKLISETQCNGINYETYYNIIDEYFDNPNIRFYQKQIYTTIVFKNLEWFKETSTYKCFKNILSNNNDILIHDPKRLLSALLNMRSAELIKRFLYNLYTKYENYEWTVYDSFLAMRYLLYRNFKNKKLLNILKEKDNKLYMYVIQYIKNDWTENIINTNISEMEICDQALMESIFFIRFLSIIEYNKENYLTYQAYMKSFFDSVTSNLVYIKENKKEYFFEKRRILQFYKKNFNIDEKKEEQISCFCDSRNENPLCHSNIKIIKNKNMKEKIIKESKDIVEMLNKILGD
mgnify:CR=1 FL=1